MNFRSKKARGGVDLDENELSKDGENSLSQSLFDDQTSSRTRMKIKIFFYFSSSIDLSFSFNWSKNQ